MSALAVLVMFLGNSTASMPFRMELYVFMGSGPVKGGVPGRHKVTSVREMAGGVKIKSGISQQKINIPVQVLPILNKFISAQI